MSLHDYTTDKFVTTVNGRPITDWGEAAQPFTDAPIDPKASLRRGRGGNALKLGSPNPGRTVTLSLNPGGRDSAFLQGLFESGATVEISRQQIGTLEAAIGVEGVITNDGPVGRGGTTVTDDVFIMEFNVWNAAKGGE